MAKIDIQYDTNDKSMKMTHSVDGDMSNIKHVGFHSTGKDKSGADHYEMEVARVEHDAENDTTHIHRMHAEKYEKQEVGKKVQDYLSALTARKMPKEIKKSGQI